MAEVPIKNNFLAELHVPDFGPAREFYGIFDFKELSYDPTSGGGSDLGYLVLVRDDPLGRTQLNFYGDKDKVADHAHFKDFPPDTPRGYAVEFTIPVSNVRDLWGKVVGQLVEEAVSQPLKTKRWGKQDFRVVDPYGFYVRFTELVDWGQE